MKILGIIPARGGSKRLNNKNILKLYGKPLIGYTIEAALKAKVLDKIVVSTDSARIANVAKNRYRVEVIPRPAEFSRDHSPIEEALLHAVEYLEKNRDFCADIVVWMQTNVPIRPAGLIDQVVRRLIQTGADSCVTCYRVTQNPEVMKIIDKKGRLIPVYKNTRGIRTQEFSKKYLLDGSVLAMKAKNLFETRGIRKPHIYLGRNVIPVIQSDPMYSLEIDSPKDVPLVKYYLKRLKNPH